LIAVARFFPRTLRVAFLFIGSPQAQARAGSWLRALLCLVVLLLAQAPARAQTYVYTGPVFVYNDDLYSPYFSSTSLQATWAHTQSVLDYCQTVSGTQYCYTALNLRQSVSDQTTYNGTPMAWTFDYQTCQTPAGGQQSCNTASTWGGLDTSMTCSESFNAAAQSTGPHAYNAWCQKLTPPSPPPATCKSCVGNPIYAPTGDKIQAEPDYSAAAPGLSFTRTYRSSIGTVSSTTTAGFLNYSAAFLTPTGGCIQSNWTQHGTTGTACYPYTSMGQNDYQLATDDGRYISY
jgi:hypothetical protein